MGTETGPTSATLKRLFAVSGNTCAFLNCKQPLVHEGKVTGRVCHIKAASSGGPRFDPRQSATQRHAFENLILMCPVHHDVIDADPIAYTVERLISVKTDHETKHAGGAQPDELMTRQFVTALQDVRIQDGSLIVTQNQIGGQVAHVINNYGPPKRIITPAMRERILNVLNQEPPAQIGFASTHGDVEAHEFKSQLIDVFRSARWQVLDMQTFMFFGSEKGIVLTIPFNASERGLPQLVAQALSETGNPISGNRGDMATDCGLYVLVFAWRVGSQVRRCNCHVRS